MREIILKTECGVLLWARSKQQKSVEESSEDDPAWKPCCLEQDKDLGLISLKEGRIAEGYLKGNLQTFERLLKK